MFEVTFYNDNLIIIKIYLFFTENLTMAGTSGGSGNKRGTAVEEGEWEYYDDNKVLTDFWQVI